MQSMTTLLTMVTAAPYLQPELLLKRNEVTCGDLRGQYSNAQPPVCVGQTSICTFSNGLQGCCDDGGSCKFYTSCNGPLAPTGCTDTSCLECPRSIPYCTKFNFYDSDITRAYDGFACGTIDIGQFTIYGVVGSTIGDSVTGTDAAPTPTSDSASTAGYITSTSLPASSTSTSTESLSTSTTVVTSSTDSISESTTSHITNLMSSTSMISSSQLSSSSYSSPASSASSTTRTSPAPASTSTAVPKKDSAPGPGVIAGAVVGSIIAVALLSAAGFFLYRRITGAGATRSGDQPPMIQTNYR